MREIIFEVTEAPEGGYDARALGYSVFTQGEDWDDLKKMVRDAVRCHFDDREPPRVIRLHFLREEAIAVRDCPEISRGGISPSGLNVVTATASPGRKEAT